MRVSMSSDRIAVVGLMAGPLGVVVAGCMLCSGMTGCSPAVPPATPARPVASHTAGDRHDDHDHDHDHDHGHNHDDHDHKDGRPSGNRDAHADHAEHDDHDHVHPETLAAGVSELEAMWGHVKAALKAGDRDAADEKVHAVGHLLEDFESLLAKEKAEAQEFGKKATQEVFDCFDKLDEAFHGDEDDLKKLDVEAIGQRLEAAIKTLKGLVAAEAK